MLIRRLLLFFGIFFELSLLDSITVLPIFFFKRAKGVLTTCCIATADYQQLPPPLLQLPPLLTTTTLELPHPPGSRLGRGEKRQGTRFNQHCVYRCYVTLWTHEKSVSLGLFPIQSHPREKIKLNHFIFFFALVMTLFVKKLINIGLQSPIKYIVFRIKIHLYKDVGLWFGHFSVLFLSSLTIISLYGAKRIKGKSENTYWKTCF